MSPPFKNFSNDNLGPWPPLGPSLVMALDGGERLVQSTFHEKSLMGIIISQEILPRIFALPGSFQFSATLSLIFKCNQLLCNKTKSGTEVITSVTLCKQSKHMVPATEGENFGEPTSSVTLKSFFYHIIQRMELEIECRIVTAESALKKP